MRLWMDRLRRMMQRRINIGGCIRIWIVDVHTASRMVICDGASDSFLVYMQVNLVVVIEL